MPQALKVQQDQMKEWFGDSVGTAGPLMFLYRRGWMDKAGILHPPTPSYRPSVYEFICLNFLADEWDFGYVVDIALSIPLTS